MFGLGMPELLVVLIIALVVFGATKLPQIGSSLGTALREFKKSIESPPNDTTPPPPEQIVCNQCRRPLEKDWLVCPHCGTKRETNPGA